MSYIQPVAPFHDLAYASGRSHRNASSQRKRRWGEAAILHGEVESLIGRDVDFPCGLEASGFDFVVAAG